LTKPIPYGILYNVQDTISVTEGVNVSNTLTPIKAIRKKCLDCAGRKPSIVRYCDSADCALHFFRFGKNPRRKGIGPRIPIKSYGLLDQNPNTTQDFEADLCRLKKSTDMIDSTDFSPAFEEMTARPVKIESQGKIEICKAGKEITIRVKTDD
jgi:hypothetical protein